MPLISQNISMIRDHDFQKCGEIMVAPKRNTFAMSCIYCVEIFTRLPAFMRHLHQRHTDELQFEAKDAVVEVYAVEELVSRTLCDLEEDSEESGVADEDFDVSDNEQHNEGIKNLNKKSKIEVECNERSSTRHVVKEATLGNLSILNALEDCDVSLNFVENLDDTLVATTENEMEFKAAEGNEFIKQKNDGQKEMDVVPDEEDDDDDMESTLLKRIQTDLGIENEEDHQGETTKKDIRVMDLKEDKEGNDDDCNSSGEDDDQNVTLTKDNIRKSLNTISNSERVTGLKNLLSGLNDLDDLDELLGNIEDSMICKHQEESKQGNEQDECRPTAENNNELDEFSLDASILRQCLADDDVEVVKENVEKDNKNLSKNKVEKTGNSRLSALQLQVMADWDLDGIDLEDCLNGSVLVSSDSTAKSDNILDITPTSSKKCTDVVEKPEISKKENMVMECAATKESIHMPICGKGQLNNTPCAPRFVKTTPKSSQISKNNKMTPKSQKTTRIKKESYSKQQAEALQEIVLDAMDVEGGHNNPKSGAHNTLKSGVHNTPKSGAHNTPKSGVHNNPKSGVHNTPKSEVHNTPKSIPKTPKSTKPFENCIQVSPKCRTPDNTKIISEIKEVLAENETFIENIENEPTEDNSQNKNIGGKDNKIISIASESETLTKAANRTADDEKELEPNKFEEGLSDENSSTHMYEENSKSLENSKGYLLHSLLNKTLDDEDDLDTLINELERDETINDTDEPIKETHQSIKDKNEMIKETNETIKETNEQTKDANVSIKETSKPIKDTNASMKDADETIKDTNESITETNESITNTNVSITETYETAKDANEATKDTNETPKDTNESITDTHEPIKNTNEIIAAKEKESTQHQDALRDNDEASLEDEMAIFRKFIGLNSDKSAEQEEETKPNEDLVDEDDDDFENLLNEDLSKALEKALEEENIDMLKLNADDLYLEAIQEETPISTPIQSESEREKSHHDKKTLSIRSPKALDSIKGKYRKTNQKARMIHGKPVKYIDNALKHTNRNVLASKLGKKGQLSDQQAQQKFNSTLKNKHEAQKLPETKRQAIAASPRKIKENQENSLLKPNLRKTPKTHLETIQQQQNQAPVTKIKREIATPSSCFINMQRGERTPMKLHDLFLKQSPKTQEKTEEKAANALNQTTPENKTYKQSGSECKKNLSNMTTPRTRKTPPAASECNKNHSNMTTPRTRKTPPAASQCKENLSNMTTPRTRKTLPAKKISPQNKAVTRPTEKAVSELLTTPQKVRQLSIKLQRCPSYVSLNKSCDNLTNSEEFKTPDQKQQQIPANKHTSPLSAQERENLSSVFKLPNGITISKVNLNTTPTMVEVTPCRSNYCKQNFTEQQVVVGFQDPATANESLIKCLPTSVTVTKTKVSLATRLRARQASIDIVTAAKSPKKSSLDYKSYAVNRSARKKEVLNRMRTIKKKIFKSIQSNSLLVNSKIVKSPIPKKSRRSAIQIENVQILPNVKDGVLSPLLSAQDVSAQLPSAQNGVAQTTPKTAINGNNLNTDSETCRKLIVKSPSETTPNRHTTGKSPEVTQKQNKTGQSPKTTPNQNKTVQSPKTTPKQNKAGKSPETTPNQNKAGQSPETQKQNKTGQSPKTTPNQNRAGQSPETTRNQYKAGKSPKTTPKRTKKVTKSPESQEMPKKESKSCETTTTPKSIKKAKSSTSSPKQNNTENAIQITPPKTSIQAVKTPSTGRRGCTTKRRATSPLEAECPKRLHKSPAKQQISTKAPELEATQLDMSESVADFLQRDLKANRLNVDSILNEPMPVDAITPDKTPQKDTEKQDIKSNEMKASGEKLNTSDANILDDILEQVTTEDTPDASKTKTEKVVSSPTKCTVRDYDDSKDLELLGIVGLKIINDKDVEDLYYLEEVDAMRAKAQQFADICKHCPRIFSHSKVSEPPVLFKKLHASVNSVYNVNLSINDIKRIVNLIIIWYTNCYNNRLIEKKPISESTNYYLLILNFIPKTSKRLYYCEFCDDQFNTEHKYYTHRIQHTGAHFPYSCKNCQAGFSRTQSLKAHQLTCAKALEQAKTPSTNVADKAQQKLPKTTANSENKLPTMKYKNAVDYEPQTIVRPEVSSGPVQQRRLQTVYKCAKCEMSFITESCVKLHLQTCNRNQRRQPKNCTPRPKPKVEPYSRN